jgi:hypothetical protein
LTFGYTVQYVLACVNYGRLEECNLTDTSVTIPVRDLTDTAIA